MSTVRMLTNQAVTSGEEQQQSGAQLPIHRTGRIISTHTSEVHKSHRLKGPIGIGCIHNHPVSRFIACQHLNLSQEGDPLKARGQPPF